MGTSDAGADLYLDLLARALSRALFEDSDLVAGVRSEWAPTSHWVQVAHRLAPLLGKAHLELVIKRQFDPAKRENGRDWPARAETMTGLKRLANARSCIESILADDIPGDVIEAGVWRGGMSIFMRGVLKAHGVSDRKVWLADSFQGVPPSDPDRYPADRGLNLARHGILSVGANQVRHNFDRYGLMDDQVQFIIGWFRETLLNAPINKLSLLRIDGDLYGQLSKPSRRSTQSSLSAAIVLSTTTTRSTGARWRSRTIGMPMLSRTRLSKSTARRFTGESQVYLHQKTIELLRHLKNEVILCRQ